MSRGTEERGAAADELWAIASLPRLPHEVVPGLEGLDPVSAIRFAVSVRRARMRYRQRQVNALLHGLQADKDTFGIGRALALLSAGVVEG